jgi:amino acid transporter
MSVTAESGRSDVGTNQLQRAIDWKGAFWVASGVPPLVLFSIGGIAGTTGRVAFLVWIISMVMGFVQSFTYAEIAGMFGSKSGGASVYGATAWLRYSKFIAPLSVWCNWFAWSPVLSLGSAIAAGYIINMLAPLPIFTEQSAEVAAWLADPANAGKAPADAIAAVTTAATPALRTWSLISFPIPGLAQANINATFFIGLILLLIVFAIQHRGILGTANVQKVFAVIVLLPLLVIGLWPILAGKINYANFSPLVPPVASYSPEPGQWNIGGWTLFLGGLYIAAWSTYAFETAVCYTSELKNPARDTIKAITAAGLLCMLFYFLVPFTFQGVLGVEGMLAPGIVDGTGIGHALAAMVGAGPFITQILVILMIFALVQAIMTAMAGSSRTLYQGSVDGWLPKYLSHVNSHGAPTYAMFSDLAFNIFLLAIASDLTGYFFVLAVSNAGYMIFNFLNLNAGWIHRIDSGHVKRPWKAPDWLIGLNTLLAFVNALFLGAGAKVWGYQNALWVGFAFAALIIPVFAYRHYVQDGGKFPPNALAELGLKGHDRGERKAGIWPYATLAAGLVVVLIADAIFTLPK